MERRGVHSRHIVQAIQELLLISTTNSKIWVKLFSVQHRNSDINSAEVPFELLLFQERESSSNLVSI